MLSKKVEEALNDQVHKELESSQYYLAMASWAETQGLSGIPDYLYQQADEERAHMLKLMKYVNERGGHATVQAVETPPKDYESLQRIFELILEHEIGVTQSINDLVHLCYEERDYTTQNFMQWYVSEQIEEEATARTILDKLKLIGKDTGGLYLFDRDILSLKVTSAAFDNPA